MLVCSDLRSMYLFVHLTDDNEMKNQCVLHL